MIWNVFYDSEGGAGSIESPAPAEGTESTPDANAGEQNSESTGGEKAAPETLLDKAGEGEGESASTPTGAPESYEDFTFPDGINVDNGLLEPFQEVAKTADLSQEQAQAVATFYAEHVASTQEMLADQTAKQIQGWNEECAKDEVIGGSDHQEKLQVAIRGFREFGSTELLDLLNSTGLGSHPAMVRAFYHLGKSLKEDNIVAGQDGQGERSAAEIMFPLSAGKRT